MVSQGLWKGLVGLITGGASGLGKATVERFVRNGAKVVLCDLPSSQGEQVAQTFGDEKCLFVPTDIRCEGDVKNSLEVAEKRFGGLNALVNCAFEARCSEVYKFNQDKPCWKDDFEAIFSTSVLGTFNVIRLSVELMAKNEPNNNGQRGVIVNRSSALGFDGNYGQSILAGSAGGVNSMTLPLSRDLARTGIRVVTIAAGNFKLKSMDFPPFVQSYFSLQTPTPSRYGKPHEFADMVESIIDNPMLNGEVIRVDGAFRRI